MPNAITVYPNPTEDQFTVYGLQNTAGGEFALELFDALGQKVYSTRQQTVNRKPKTVNCKPFPAGVYIHHPRQRHDDE